jgi:hypothetical protein
MTTTGPIDLEPRRVTPLHEVRDADKFASLVAAMRDGGWQGRPVLVTQWGDGWVALTGSHRVAAAVEAGLDEIPCLATDADAFHDAHDSHPYEWVTNNHYEDLAAAIREAGDDDAADLMDAEEID